MFWQLFLKTELTTWAPPSPLLSFFLGLTSFCVYLPLMQGSLHCLVLTLCKSTAGSVRGFQQAAPRHTIYISLLKPTFKFEKPGTLFLRWSSTSASAESASKLSVHLPWWSNLTSWHVGRCPVQTNEGLLGEVPLEGCPGAQEVTGANCFQSPLSNFFTEKFWRYCCISHLCR